MRTSLRLRLLAFSALFVALALAAVWQLLGSLFERQIAHEYEARLGAVIDTLAANLVKGDGGWRLEREPVDPRYTMPGSGEYWQVTGQGVSLRSRSLWDGLLKGEGRKVAGGPIFTQTGPIDDPVVALASAITIGEGADAGSFTIVAATPRENFDTAVADFRSQLVAMLTIAGLALLVASALQVTLGLAPLTALSRQVADVRSGAARRLPETGPPETGALVREVNKLLEAREQDVEKARHRASNLAHALKTPLTILAQIAEQLSGKSARAAEIGEQVEAIRQRVDRQLALARMSALTGVSTEVEPVIRKLVYVVRRLPTEAPLRWNLTLEPGLAAACDAADFSEALGNVLDNARKFAVSAIEVASTAGPGTVAVTVCDDGPGVAEHELARIIERGGRLDSKASETGLGLAITAEILEAHGGSLTVANGPEGGLAVTLAWPRAG